MSNHNDATCIRTLGVLGTLLFGFFLVMIFLARALVY
jgi:hypothetical protein